MTSDELRNMVYAIAIAHEICTNHGRESYGNPEHHKFVKEYLLKISEKLNQDLSDAVFEEKQLNF